MPAKRSLPKGAPPVQLPLWAPESAWRPPKLGDLPAWAGAKRVSIDTETCDKHLKQLGPGVRRGAYMAGISFAIEDGPSAYVPMRHAGGDNVEDVGAALRYFRDQAKSFKGEIVGAHLMYDLDHMAEEEIVFRSARRFYDVQVADPLINELHMSYSLDAIAKRWGFDGKDEELLKEAARHYNVDAKGGMYLLPARFVGPYADTDAVLPLEILAKQEVEIANQGIESIFDLESELLPVLVKMRRRGVLVDQDRLAKIETWSLDQEAEALAKVKHLTGVDIGVGNVWSPGAMAPALEYIGVKVPMNAGRGKNSKPEPSITKELLAGIDHPVAEAMAWARKVNKLRTTFAASVRTHMCKGRIHATFNQLRKTDDASGAEKGAAYGRLSSENPNLQQQPARDDFAKEWRSIYLPEPGTEWYSNDYSQQEPRWATHFAEVMELEGAYEAAEQYRNDPTTDNHDMVAGIVGIPRKPAKEIYLGIIYGMGGATLCDKLGLPTRWAVFYRGYDKEARYFESAAEAKACASETDGRAFRVAGVEGQGMLNKVNDRLPFLKKMAKAAERKAKKRGYIITILGRRCRFPQRQDGSFDWAHKALNRVIQGSSADQTKKAVVEGDRAGYFLQLQVHDEITGSGDRKEAEGMADIMRHCVPSTIPFNVDVEMGPSWGGSMG